VKASRGDLLFRKGWFASSTISCAFCWEAAEFDPVLMTGHTWYADIIRRCFPECVSRRMDVHLPILSRLWDFIVDVMELHAIIAVPPGLYRVVVGVFVVERIRRLWWNCFWAICSIFCRTL